MKTLIAIVVCLAVLATFFGIICCMASSMVSRKEEKMNSKYKEENNYEW